MINPLRQQAAIAEQTHRALLSRLTFMTLQPKTILVVNSGFEEGYQDLEKQYPNAVVFTNEHLLAEMTHTIDIIFANLFQPWQSIPRTVLTQAKQWLTPNGLFLFAAFGLDTLKEYPTLQTTCHELCDMHTVGDALLQAGLVDPVLEVDHYEMLYPNMQRLCHDLSATTYPTTAALDTLLANVPIPCSTYPLTYEVIYGHAFAPLTSAQLPSHDGTVTIPLSHIQKI